MSSKIVLADGDESVRRMVARVLESFQYKVLTATTASEALSICQDSNPDLVLADLELLTGRTQKIIEVLRSKRPPIPLLVMDAWANRSQALKLNGFAAWVEKPLDLPGLIRTVQRLLEIRLQAAEQSALADSATSLRLALKPA